MLASRLVSVFFTLVFLLFAWMTYDNVWTDLAPIQALAEEAACKVKDCKKQHLATQIDRLPDGQTFTYRWQDGMLVIHCRRSSYAFGARRCEVQP